LSYRDINWLIIRLFFGVNWLVKTPTRSKYSGHLKSWGFKAHLTGFLNHHEEPREDKEKNVHSLSFSFFALFSGHRAKR